MQFHKAIAELEDVTPEDLNLASVKMRSSLYDQMGSFYGIGKLNLLASFALFDDNPAKINTLDAEFKKVTPALIRKTVTDYMRPTNRTILFVEPKTAKP